MFYSIKIKSSNVQKVILHAVLVNELFFPSRFYEIKFLITAFLCSIIFAFSLRQGMKNTGYLFFAVALIILTINTITKTIIDQEYLYEELTWLLRGIIYLTMILSVQSIYNIDNRFNTTLTWILVAYILISTYFAYFEFFRLNSSPAFGILKNYYWTGRHGEFYARLKLLNPGPGQLGNKLTLITTFLLTRIPYFQSRIAKITLLLTISLGFLLIFFSFGRTSIFLISISIFLFIYNYNKILSLAMISPIPYLFIKYSDSIANRIVKVANDGILNDSSLNGRIQKWNIYIEAFDENVLFLISGLPQYLLGQRETHSTDSELLTALVFFGLPVLILIYIPVISAYLYRASKFNKVFFQSMLIITITSITFKTFALNEFGMIFLMVTYLIMKYDVKDNRTL